MPTSNASAEQTVEKIEAKNEAQDFYGGQAQPQAWEKSDWRALSWAEQTLVHKGYTFTGFWTRRCSHKNCGYKFRVKAPLRGWSEVVKVPCPKCKWVSKKPGMCNALRIFGRDSEKHECGAKCLNAKGPSCDCSCRGENHGAGHQGGVVQTVEVTALNDHAPATRRA